MLEMITNLCLWSFANPTLGMLVSNSGSSFNIQATGGVTKTKVEYERSSFWKASLAQSGSQLGPIGLLILAVDCVPIWRLGAHAEGKGGTIQGLSDATGLVLWSLWLPPLSVMAAPLLWRSAVTQWLVRGLQAYGRCGSWCPSDSKTQIRESVCPVTSREDYCSSNSNEKLYY